MSLADLRREYTLASLDLTEVDPDPIVQFMRWFDEAHAPIRLPNGRLPKYAADSSTANRSTVPPMRTWRSISFQKKHSPARGLASMSRPLRER